MGSNDTITLHNAASGSRLPNVGAYLDSENNSLSFTTKKVSFQPDYNLLSANDVTVHGGIVYRNSSSKVVLTDQPVIKDNRITLLTVNGELDASGETVELIVEPVSAYSRTVTVTNETNSPVVLTVPSEVSVSRWEELLSEEISTGKVTAVESGPTQHSVNISLEAGSNYELRVAKLAVTEESGATGVAEKKSRYIVSEVDRNTETEAEGRKKLTVEVRDKYSNPISNAVVNFSASQGDFELADGNDTSPPFRTDEEGQVTVWYNATPKIGTHTVKAYLGTTEPAAKEKKISWSVFNDYSGSGGASGGGGINEPLLVIQSADLGGGNNNYDLTLENVGTNTVNLTHIRYAFHSDTKNQPSSATLDYESDSYSLMYRGDYVKIDPAVKVQPNTTATLSFTINGDNNLKNDWDVYSAILEDRFTTNYFVAPD